MEELLQFLYLTPVGIVKFGSDGAIHLMNPMASALLISLTPHDRLNNIYAALAPLAPDLHRLVTLFGKDAGTITDQPRLEARSNGKTVVVALTVSRVNASVYMAVLKDVTQIAEQERALLRDRHKFHAIFDHVRDYAIYTITLDGIIDEWNPSLERYGGWLADDVQGRSVELLIPPDDPDRPHIGPLLAEALRIGSIETEGWRLTRSGSRLWANSVVTALPDEAGAVRGFVVVSRDMTERKRMEDEMRRLATVDGLTGAYNRRHGDLLLAAEFSRRARDGLPFAVLMLDVDHFKAVNDRFGHAIGDAVLQALTRTCKNALRPVDIIARWGGEEFLLILPATDEAAAMSAAERLRAALAATAVSEDGEASISFTVSIGVALPQGEGPLELLRRCDAALYDAKASGRNRVMLAR